MAREPFVDERVVGVGTRQNVYNPRSFLQRVNDIYLDYRYFDENAAQTVVGAAVSCLSGRTAVYRRWFLVEVADEFVNETFAGRQFETGRVMADGNVQILRWLNIGGNVQRGPAIFYDEEAPFQGYSRSSGLRVTLQPNAQINNNISYNFVTFKNRGTGEHVYDVHVLNLRNTYQFNARFFIRAVAQFDSSRERVLSDFLASYELSPGTVIHAGYGSLYGRAYEEIHFDRYLATARAFFFKASYRAHF